MAPQLVFAALALACLGVASQPDCNELVKPLADLSLAVGKWIMYAATTDSKEMTALIKTYTSARLHMKHKPDGNPQIMEIVTKADEKCVYIETNVTAVGDKLRLAYTLHNQTLVYDGQYLDTCPDCLLWSDSTKSLGSGEVRRLLFLTRTGNLTLPNYEVFKQQAACLNFTLGFHRGSDTDLCPEEKEEIAVKEDQ